MNDPRAPKQQKGTVRGRPTDAQLSARGYTKKQIISRRKREIEQRREREEPSLF